MKVIGAEIDSIREVSTKHVNMRQYVVTRVRKEGPPRGNLGKIKRRGHSATPMWHGRPLDLEIIIFYKGTN